MFSFDNREMDAYFQSLSPMVQHTIIMCGVKPRNLEELRNLAEGITGETGTPGKIEK